MTPVDTQNHSESGVQYFLTLNPPHTPKDTVFRWSTSHPIPSVAACRASSELNVIQGRRGLWFCGAYQGALIILKCTFSSSYVEHLIACNNLIVFLVIYLLLQGYGFPEDGVKVHYVTIIKL